MIRSVGQKSLPAIGFLTVTRDVEQGLFGGYLVLNFLGRPLEFHCTAPVRPNRAQEILYGPTLDPYLYGERIGQALLEKSKVAPQLVLTDCPAVLVARLFVATPMVLVLGAAAASDEGEAVNGTPPSCDTAGGHRHRQRQAAWHRGRVSPTCDHLSWAVIGWRSTPSTPTTNRIS